MEEFMSFMNEILKNRVQDVYEQHENRKKVLLSPMSTIMNKVGINFQYKDENDINEELQKLGAQKRKSPLLGIVIPMMGGFLFYTLWLDLFLDMQNEIVKILLTMIFTDIVFAIYGYLNYKSSVKEIQNVFGEVQCEVNKKVMDSDQKILTRLHIPMPDAKLESYQNICRILKSNDIMFPENVQSIREEIDYLKQRQQDGVFEIRQDEICVICPQLEETE